MINFLFSFKEYQQILILQFADGNKPLLLKLYSIQINILLTNNLINICIEISKIQTNLWMVYFASLNEIIRDICL